jgi:hypothetical protein
LTPRHPGSSIGDRHPGGEPHEEVMGMKALRWLTRVGPAFVIAAVIQGQTTNFLRTSPATLVTQGTQKFVVCP